MDNNENNILNNLNNNNNNNYLNNNEGERRMRREEFNKGERVKVYQIEGEFCEIEKIISQNYHNYHNNNNNNNNNNNKKRGGGGGRRWIPLSLISSSITPLKIKLNNSIDENSIVDLPNKGKTNAKLIHFLSHRPSEDELLSRGILPSCSPIVYHNQKTLEKKKKVDVLSTFFRSKYTKN